MTFREYIGLMRRRWWVLALLTLVGAGAAGALTAVVQPSYVSQSSILISMSGAEASGGLLQSNDVTTQRAATYGSLGTSQFVLQAAATATGSDVEDLESAVSVTPRDGQAFLDVTATATTAARAQAWAQAVADRLVVAVNQSDGIGPSSGVALRVVTPASLPQVAVSPRPRNNVLIGSAAGLIVGACLVVLRDSLDGRIRNATDVTRSRRVASVLTVPADGGQGDGAGLREIHRRLHATLRVTGVDAGPVAVVAVSTGVHVADTAVGLARAVAATGRSVVVVDVGPRPGAGGDGARPPGLLDVVTGGTTVDDLLEAGRDGDLTVVHSGGATADELARLHTTGFQRLLTGLSSRFDCVVYACPPPWDWSPTLLVVPASSSTVLVARRSRTTTSELAETLDVLEGVGVHAGHVVLE